MLPSLTTHIHVTSLQKKRIDAIFRYKILQAAYELHGKKQGCGVQNAFFLFSLGPIYSRSMGASTYTSTICRHRQEPAS
jgi:hypothetical protein